MKKYTLIIAAALSFVMLAGCGENKTSNSGDTQSGSVSAENSSTETVEMSLTDKTAKLQEDVEFPSMVAVKEDNLEVYYGFTKDDVEEFSSYICGSGAMPDEFGIFIAKDEDAAAKIKDGLENRVEAQKKTYEDYPLAANELYKLDDAFVNVNGTTVIYAICADNSMAREILG